MNEESSNYRLFFDSNLDKKIQRTIGYNRFFKKNWIELNKKRVNLTPGGKTEISGEIKLEQLDAQKKFEKILWLEDDQKNKEFIRLLIENR